MECTHKTLDYWSIIERKLVFLLFSSLCNCVIWFSVQIDLSHLGMWQQSHFYIQCWIILIFLKNSIMKIVWWIDDRIKTTVAFAVDTLILPWEILLRNQTQMCTNIYVEEACVCCCVAHRINLYFWITLFNIGMPQNESFHGQEANEMLLKFSFYISIVSREKKMKIYTDALKNLITHLHHTGIAAIAKHISFWIFCIAQSNWIKPALKLIHVWRHFVLKWPRICEIMQFS